MKTLSKQVHFSVLFLASLCVVLVYQNCAKPVGRAQFSSTLTCPAENKIFLDKQDGSHEIICNTTQPTPVPSPDSGGLKYIPATINPEPIEGRKKLFVLQAVVPGTQNNYTQQIILDAITRVNGNSVNTTFLRETQNRLSFEVVYGGTIAWNYKCFNDQPNVMNLPQQFVEQNPQYGSWSQYFSGVLILPQTGCPDVAAAAGGKAIVIYEHQNPEYFEMILSHEIGHIARLGHSGYVACTNADPTNCVYADYRDYSTLMGWSVREGQMLSAIQKLYMGLLSASNVQNAQLGRYRIFKRNDSTGSGKLLQLLLLKNTYSTAPFIVGMGRKYTAIEYLSETTPVMGDFWGVQILRVGDKSSGSALETLNNLPQTLRTPGQRFVDNVNGFEILLISINQDYADIEIKKAGTQNPRLVFNGAKFEGCNSVIINVTGVPQGSLRAYVLNYFDNMKSSNCSEPTNLGNNNWRIECTSLNLNTRDENIVSVWDDKMSMWTTVGPSYCQP